MTRGVDGISRQRRSRVYPARLSKTSGSCGGSITNPDTDTSKFVCGAGPPGGAPTVKKGIISKSGWGSPDRSHGSLPRHKRIAAAEAPVAGVEASALGPNLGRQHSPLFTSFPQAASDLMHTVIHRQPKTEDSYSWAWPGGVLAGRRSRGACRRLRMGAPTRIGSGRTRKPS